MNCPQCQAPIQPGNQFCFRCGGKISITGEAAAQSQAKATSGAHRRQTEGGAGLFLPVPVGAPVSPVPAGSPFGVPVAALFQSGSGGPRRSTVLGGILDTPSPVPPPPEPAPVSTRGQTRLDTGARQIESAEKRARPGRILGWMVSYDHEPLGMSFVLRAGRTTIGTAPDNMVALPLDSKVSAHHAEIICRSGLCGVVDVRSTNGTFVNGEDLGINGSISLISGDVVGVGDSQFVVFLVNAEQNTKLWPSMKWGRRR